MFKQIILLPILLPLSMVALAKKKILPIELVIAQADVIAVGEIIGVGITTYDLKVSEYIKGEKGKVLRVQQFEEWTCDTRYARAARGQKLFLFLQLHNGILTIINGSTGEIPIIDNQVILRDEEYKHIAYQIHPYRLELPEFKEGIKKFLQCFEIPLPYKDFLTNTFVQKCNDAEVGRFIGTSKFTAWLYNKIKKAYDLKIA